MKKWIADNLIALIGMVFAVLAGYSAGIVWTAKIESDVAETKEDVRDLKVTAKAHGEALAEIKGRLSPN